MSRLAVFPLVPLLLASAEPGLRTPKDTVGYPSTPSQMARVWELAGTSPSPALGEMPAPGVAAWVLGP